MVAFKLDQQVQYSWTMIFCPVWTGFAILAVFILTVRTAAEMSLLKDVQMSGCLCKLRAWQCPVAFLVPIGFVSIALGAFAHFFGLLAVAQKLDGHQIQLSLIFGPSILSWVLMWTSGALTALALLDRERQRRPITPDPLEQRNEYTSNQPTIINIDALSGRSTTCGLKIKIPASRCTNSHPGKSHDTRKTTTCKAYPGRAFFVQGTRR